MVQLKTISLAVAAALALAACGGGGGGSSTGSNTGSSGTTISGKAIDGYLKGATVCVDMNWNDACDTSEPSAKTGAGGAYSIAGLGNSAVGKNLLVLIDSNTVDEARPADFRFSAPVTLVRQLDTLQGQIHISPLTTMVAAEVAKGSSLKDAKAKVEAILGVSPDADFITSKPEVSTKAQALVDAMVTVAKANGGTLDVTSILAAASLFTQANGNTSGINLGAIQHEKDNIGQLPADVRALLTAGVYEYGDYSNDTNSLRYDDVYPAKWLELTAAGSPGGTVKGFRMSLQLSADGKKFTWKDEVFNEEKNQWEIDSRDSHGHLGKWAVRQDGSWGPFRPASYESSESLDVIEIGKDSITLKDADGLQFKFENLRVFNRADTPVNEVIHYRNYKLVSTTDMKAQIAGVLSATAQEVRGSARQLGTELNTSAWKCSEIDGGYTSVQQDGIRHCNYIGSATTKYTSVRDALKVNPSVQGDKYISMYGGFFERFEGNLDTGTEGKAIFHYYTYGPDGSVSQGTDTESVRWKLIKVLGHDVIAFDINKATFKGRLDDLDSDEEKVVILRDGVLQIGFLSNSTRFEEIVGINQSYYDQLMTGYDQMLKYLRSKLSV